MASFINAASVQAFLTERLALLQTVQAAAVKSFNAGNPAALYALPQDAVATAVGALLAVQLILMLVTRSGRSFIFKTVDTIVAVAMLAAILVIVAGLPVAVFYLTYKAAAFLGASAMQSAAYQTAVAAIKERLAA